MYHEIAATQGGNTAWLHRMSSEQIPNSKRLLSKHYFMKRMKWKGMEGARKKKNQMQKSE